MALFADPNQRVMASQVDTASAGLLLISGTAYFVYIGYTLVPITPQFVEFELVTATGAGAQTAECGLFSSPAAPNKSASQSLTKLVSTGTLTSLTAAVPVMARNNAAFATQVAAGVHLWAGLRTAMAVTQPTVAALGGDMSEGRILSLVGSGVLTGAGPFTGSLIALAALTTTAICPDLRVTLD